MFEDFKTEILPALLFAIAFVIVIGVLVTIPVYFGMKKSCMEKYAEYKPSYGFWTECRIEWKGKLTPVSMIKNINL